MLSISVVSILITAMVLPLFISYVFDGWVAKILSPYYGIKKIPSLTGKWAIVTGSNTGIGYVTVRELARKGANVIATTRSVEKGKIAHSKLLKELNGTIGIGTIEYIELDLSSMKQIKTFANKVKSKGKNIDIVMLNAGIMMPPFGLTDDGFEQQIGVNHLGHFVLVKLLNDLIKRSKSRIISVSSCAHEGPYPDGIRYETFTSNDSYNPLYAYGQSKLANILFANELASRFNGTGVTSNSLHPGMIKTELGRYIEEQIKKSFVLTLLSPIFALFNTGAMDSNTGALTQLYVATAPELAGVTGQYFHPIARTAKPSLLAQNKTLQKELWDVSEKLTRKFW